MRSPQWVRWWALIFTWVLIGTGLLSFVAAALARRGLLARALGVDIVTATSHQAPRRRLLIRQVVPWLIAGAVLSVLAYVGVNLVLALLGIGAVFVLLCVVLPPSRTLGDYIAGTYMVPE